MSNIFTSQNVLLNNFKTSEVSAHFNLASKLILRTEEKISQKVSIFEMPEI